MHRHPGIERNTCPLILGGSGRTRFTVMPKLRNCIFPKSKLETYFKDKLEKSKKTVAHILLFE